MMTNSIQLCSMCWHRIKNDEDNKCPNCREPYGDEPYKWGPLTPEQEVALKELRSKEQNSSKTPCGTNRKTTPYNIIILGSVSKPKPAVAPTIASVELNRDRLAHVRVMQKNLVFVVGLSTQIAQEQVLRRTEYFGTFIFTHNQVEFRKFLEIRSRCIKNSFSRRSNFRLKALIEFHFLTLIQNHGNLVTIGRIGGHKLRYQSVQVNIKCLNPVSYFHGHYQGQELPGQSSGTFQRNSIFRYHQKSLQLGFPTQN